MRALGFNNPIAINPTGRIIAGHARYLAARKAKLKQVPVIVLDHLDENQQCAYGISDNQLALNSSWQEELLGQQIEALLQEGFEVNLLGFSEQELKRLAACPELQLGNKDEDAAPEVARAAVSRTGDIWRLDDHRVLCGDATSSSSLEQLLGDAQAAVTFTDPPYNVAYRARSRRGVSRPIRNDDLGTDFENFLYALCRNVLARTAGAIYMFMSSSELHTLHRAFTRAGGHFSTFVIWAKHQFTLGRSDYQRQYEPILYGWRQGAERFWCGARDQGDVWFFPKPAANDLHPTMKPVALIEQALVNSSREQDLILDPCGGSGSTLIACQKTGRRAYLMEIEPLYVDVIVRRWEEFTGRAAVLEGTGATFTAVSEQRAAEAVQPAA
jgi:DNA modification methylase